MPVPTYDFIFEDIPTNVKEHCLRYPWFSNLTTEPTLKPMQTPGRQPDHDGHCSLISRTLNTPDTVSTCQSFLKLPAQTRGTDDEPKLGAMLVFYSLGLGLEGNEGVCHGGFLSAAVDHAMGCLARAYSTGLKIYTRYLHVDYQRPLRLPGPVLSRTWITKVLGRKLWICGRMEDEEGNSYITAEGFIIRSGMKL